LTVELVLKPYVKLLGSTSFNYPAVEDFAEKHGLKEIMEDTNTPIGKISNSGDSDADLLSEFAGRFCYRAWGKGRSTDDYLENILKEGHGNVLAHANFSFIITGVSRALTHELIRHHVGTNPSQESQRYVTADSGEIEVVGYKANRAVVPPLIIALNADYCDPVERRDPILDEFSEAYEASLASYNRWLNNAKLYSLPNANPTVLKKRANEAARCFLPNASETRLVWTMNARAARWIIEQRGSEHADLEIRRLAVELTSQLKNIAPLIFNDAEIYLADDGFKAVKVKYSKP
jgi:thymidylate synthase (FAD)